MNNIFKILLIFTLLNVLELSSEISGRVYWNSDSTSNYVNLGPCFIEDSLITSFTLLNTGTDSLIIEPVDPTFSLYVSPTEKTEDQFREFRGPIERTLPYTLTPENNELTLSIGFFPLDTSIVYPLGPKEANLNLGLKTMDNETIAVKDSFFLKAYKTAHYIWGYETILNFDSVYVNTSSPKELEWKVKSTWVDNIEIVNQELTNLSPIVTEPEFSFKKYDVNPIFVNKYDVIDWELSYLPLDITKDSAVLRLNYYPDKENFPDSLDHAWVKMIGTGVQHDLRILNANYDFNGDTLDFGDVRINSEHNAIMVIANRGNLPFGVLTQEIVDNISSDPEPDFTITERYGEIRNIRENENEDMRIRFIPQIAGKRVSRIVFNTDLALRDIHGVPASAMQTELYIKANVLSPRLDMTADTIDFGNVIINSLECPSISDTVITLRNTGNDILRIFDINVDPGSVFSVNKSLLQIEQGAEEKLKISFNANDNNISDFEEKLNIIYEFGSGTDTISVVLKANGIPPISGKLEIPDIASKPGRLIEVPIILTQNSSDIPPVQFAKTFNTKITFDQTLLRFRSTNTIGTAVEGAFINVDDTEKNAVTFEIDNIADYFAAKDTIIKLYFDTFLGESISTPISFVESMTYLSDDNCIKAINIDGKIESGIFSLDSICGLEYKAVPRSGSSFVIQDIYPVPASDHLNLTYNLPFKTDVELKLVDSFGNILKHIIEVDQPAGEYTVKITTDDINSGAYSLQFHSGLYFDRKSIIITK